MSILYLDFLSENSQLLSKILSDIPLTEGNINWIKLLDSIETVKIEPLANLVKKSLDQVSQSEDPPTKIFIVVKFIKNLDWLMELLSKYHPVIVRSSNFDFVNNQVFIMSRYWFDQIKDSNWPFRLITYLTLGFKDVPFLICDKQNKQELKYTARHYS